MRERLTEERLREFMRTLARETNVEGRVYIAGGATAVLLGWRENTLDVDLKMIPEHDRLLRAISELKERMRINIEQASPDDFIPPLPGWEDRSPFITREGKLSFHHYDFYAQALAKIERAHDIDRHDVQRMLRSGLVTPERLMELFVAIEPALYRYSAIDAPAFRRRVETTIASA
jgi:hypothetical protein